MQERELYNPGDILVYEPTEQAKRLGDTPGTIEILSDNGHSFVVKIIDGILNLSNGKEGTRVLVAHGSQFEKGLVHPEPTVVESGLTFDDVFGE